MTGGSGCCHVPLCRWDKLLLVWLGLAAALAATGGTYFCFRTERHGLMLCFALALVLMIALLGLGVATRAMGS
jgi:hypothetical protein